MARKRMLKDYVALYHNPEHLAPGVQVTLWPNGEPEIWLKTADGLGLRVKVGNGPAGLGLCIDRMTATPDLTVSGMVPNGPETPVPCIDGAYSLEVCQHRTDARSQAFKRWYLHQETDADVALLGDGYRRRA